MKSNNGEPSNADLMRAMQSMSLDICNRMSTLGSRMEDCAEEVKQLRLDVDGKFAAN